MLVFANKSTSISLDNEGVVDEVIRQGKEWRIRFEAITLHPGDSVRVVGRENITLLIEPT
jgi:membrane protein implicated in regulation of membrane protease activity